MKLRSLARPALHALAALSLCATAATAAVNTGSPFYGDPPDAHHPWAIHDRNRPQPKRVEPGTFSTATQPGKPPSDAIVLFDGTAASLAKWESDPKPGEAPAPTKWIVRDGALECVPKSGYVRTKEQFGDCQLHIEWAAPVDVKGDSQGRGNSGVFLMGLAEVQVLDNYNNPTYADGFAGSVYGINPPLANALRPPGEFQVYDIVFRRPVHKDGKLVDAGRLTVFCNGVLLQDSTPLEGPGGHMKRSVPIAFPEKGPLKLQDHGNPVRFRNIWYRPLPPRSIEGGTDGVLTAEATTAKRKAIAATPPRRSHHAHRHRADAPPRRVALLRRCRRHARPSRHPRRRLRREHPSPPVRRPHRQERRSPIRDPRPPIPRQRRHLPRQLRAPRHPRSHRESRRLGQR
jgi:hypothetical protein